MPLMDCPECGHQISDRAATCPNCGAGIHTARERDGAGQDNVSVQQTSKTLKTQSMVSAGLVVLGLILVFVGAMKPEAGGWSFTFGWLLLGGGLVWLIVTLCRIGWNRE